MKLQAVLIVGLLAAISVVAAKPAAANQCSKQEEGQTFGIASDCHKYAICKKGELKVKSCDSKYNYDVVSSKCVKIDKATCATEPTIEEPQESDEQYDYLCTNVLFGIRIHPQVCDKYISCSGEKAKIEFCADGLIFSSEVIGCVAGDKISCEPLVEEPSTTTSEPDSGESTETGNGNNSGESNETGTNPEEPAGKYDYLCANVLLGSKPHPETCQKYISCYKSKAKEENCKKGYAYSSKLHLCVKQKGESCGANPEVTEPTVEPPTGSTSSSTESESDESSETGNTSGESNEAGNGNNSGESNETGTNPEEPAGKYDYLCANVLLGSKPHPETCQKYISCYKSKAKEENCKKGYAYSSKLHLCVKQKGESCGANPEVTEPTVEPPTGSTSSSTESESDESSETGNTSGESNEAGNGNNSGESNETGTNPEEPAGKYDYVCENVLLGTKPHPETCQKYISCYKSKAKEENCKKGYAYSSKLHLCVKQKGNSCDSQGPGSEPTTVTTELVTEPETQTQPQTEAPTTTVTTTEITTEVETESEPQPEPTPPSSGGDPMSPSCEGDFTGYLAIEGDCVQYVYCYQGEPSVRTCLENYIYYAPFNACLPGDPVTCELYRV
ncbi:chondroitin proteoglycan 2-like [Anopheles albimanus]|uniref:chondroitin proteoglycan 2-like n=1 Tax=Anopheles albimanus TaxID=7167 RepID=UPI00163E993B|nr:chondroitin proteoglycan 2-like [Anopheles albimanus]